MRPLVQNLIQHAPHYHLFQAIRLLEEDSNDKKMPYRFISAPTLSFPTGDLKSVQVNDKGMLILESTYFGLYGVDGPLPFYLLQAAAQEDEKGEVFRAFLDIFNNRFFQLLFEAWKRGRSALFLKNKSARYAKHLKSIAQQTFNDKSYPYVGLLGARLHSAEALRGLLKDYLKVKVKIEQFIPSWMPISQVPPLGIHSLLGDNMLIGERVLDCSQKICIQIGPLPYQKARKFFLGTEAHQALCLLIKAYIGHLTQFKLCVEILFANSCMQSLGTLGIQLGYSTWLGDREPNCPCVLVL